jgi:cell division septum initiation protein DivIVA
MAETIHVDNDLELVRKGYDPAQVQELVGKLSNELKTLAADNDQLRAQVVQLEQAAASPSAVDTMPSATPDVFAHWSNETNALLAAARENIAKVHAQAESDAAARLAEADAAAAAVRHQAQLDAELVMTEAQKQADQTNTQVADAKAQLAELVQQRASISQHLGNAKAQLTQLLSLVEPGEAPTDAPAAGAAAEHHDERA